MKNKIKNCNFNHKILPYTTRRTWAKRFKKIDSTHCEIIMFEVERINFSPCAWQGQQTLTAFGAKNLNYTILGFYNGFGILHHCSAHHVRYMCIKS
jgi:hypothetical protein